MKWCRTLILFDQGNIVADTDWKILHDSYTNAIKSIDHPLKSGKLILREKLRTPDFTWKRNGVGYLKSRFLRFMLDEEKWKSEGMVNLARDRARPPIKLYPSGEDYHEPITSDFGGFDFLTTAPSGTRIAIEWETGNISSSHRSMNKLAIALANGVVDVGVLIVPSRALYDLLTDRIGNIGELSGYLSMWESLKSTVSRGLLAVTVVEHDEIANIKDDPKFPFLPTGNDGNAARAKAAELKSAKITKKIRD